MVAKIKDIDTTKSFNVEMKIIAPEAIGVLAQVDPANPVFVSNTGDVKSKIELDKVNQQVTAKFIVRNLESANPLYLGSAEFTDSTQNVLLAGSCQGEIL